MRLEEAVEEQLRKNIEAQALAETEQLIEVKFIPAPDCWKAQQWLDYMSKVREKHNWTCARCGNKFAPDTKQLRGHHMVYLYRKQVWDYPEDLVVPLCIDCHNAIHKDGWKPPSYATEAEAREYARAHPIKAHPLDGENSTKQEDAYEEYKQAEMNLPDCAYPNEKPRVRKSKKKNVYKNRGVCLEKDVMRMLDDIKDATGLAQNIFIRATIRLLAPIKKHILLECREEEDADNVLRRYYHLVG